MCIAIKIEKESAFDHESGDRYRSTRIFFKPPEKPVRNLEMLGSILGMTSRSLPMSSLTKFQLITVHMTHFLAMFLRSEPHLCRVGKCKYTYFAHNLFQEKKIRVDYDCICLFDCVR
ncbi:hypothetical protein OIU77_011188 [Salix suchowensis]|uniref:Uncharacterized protein n=1 Tax=Salix suchowensis TaxID=1278906 RepID=A0ABQ9ABQ8_9ROSI|nr:hypothetical protein OIU77_011188 [Salix suchowensis]